METKADNETVKITYESVERPEHVQKLIDEFELDHELRSKHLLGLDGKLRIMSTLSVDQVCACLGFRNMLLSTDFDIVKPSYAREIYQDMTR